MSESWYDERPEPEQTVSGVLRAAPARSTPGGRDRLPYRLVLADGGVLPVYGPAVEDRLDRLVDEHVVLVGKVVDLSAEGFGPELWVGALG
ncbi:hypothetical protein [uncultured Phycicoccus sp.]|uniref:hypothetical protein n=1 Tax=uncultured Phycicoccus sp. TaxID=661422 RepID=UPI0026398CE6|nr:hypothetical protein [uncultured Phycicoccus sp.]